MNENGYQLENSSQFEILSQSFLNKSLVKLMEGISNSNASIQSNNSNPQQPPMKTQFIKVNESSQISINENKELEEKKEEIKSLKEKNAKLEKQLFVLRNLSKYFLIKFKDDILSKNNTYNIYQYTTNLNDSLNFSRRESQFEINTSVSLTLNRPTLKRSISSQSNLLFERQLTRPKTQIINYPHKLEFVNSYMNKNKTEKNKKKKNKKIIDIKKTKEIDENRKKLKDIYTSFLAIQKFRKKYNIPQNITNTQIKIVIENNHFNPEVAAKILLKKYLDVNK